ncbi:MAG: ADOP family duplicated permease [Gemmatimonadetes bacterium]|nr:ADOP family duplicated permease [Gemmatimonadota bacterium]
MTTPPRDPWPARFLGWLVPARYRADVLGDLVEEHRREHGKGGVSGVVLVIAVIRAGLASRWQDVVAAAGRDRAPSRWTSNHFSRRPAMFDTLSQVLGSASSTLRRNRGFTAAAVLTLALGAGATLAIFTLVSGVLLAPLPYASSERLMHVQGSPDGRYAVSMPVHNRVVAPAASVEESAAWQGWEAILGRPEDRIERRFGASVSASYFHALGVPPAAGRLFLPEDGVPGHAPVVVLSHEAWQQLFDGTPTAIGAELVLDGEPYTVIGVAPKGFLDPVAAHVLGASEPVAFWRADPPFFFDAAARGGWTAFWSIVRVRAGVEPSHLRAEVARSMREVYPSWEDDGEWLRVRGFRAMATGHLRPTLAALFAAAFLVLLIACANVANLLLSRATARSRELAVRASLGASRVRLAGQLFTENLLLAATAAVLGIGFAAVAMPLLANLLGDDLRAGQVPGLDWRVGGFALVLVLVTALMFGLLPALRTSEVRLAAVLRAGRGPDSTGGRGRGALVAAEVALGVVVLVAAGLLGRTLWNLWSTDPGFEPDSVVTAYVSLPQELFETPDAQNVAVEGLERELAALPGVSGVGLITDLPMSGAVNSTSIRRPAGAAGDPEGMDQVLVRAVTAGYFEVMGVPLLRGRVIAGSDRAGAAPVAVINRSYAALLPGGGVGHRVVVRGEPREIVGVVEDVVEFRLEDGPGDLVLYTPYPQEDQAWMRRAFHVVLRTAADPAALAEPIRGAVERASPAILLSQRIRHMSDYVARDLAAYRFRAFLLGFFAVTALLLAAAGIAAVTAYAVARSVPEIGIRMALGASSRAVVRGILAQAAGLVGVGLALGLVGSVAASRALSHFLFGVQPGDPAAYGLAAVLLSAVALLAAWIPARHAAAIDPVRALRAE